MLFMLLLGDINNDDDDDDDDRRGAHLPYVGLEPIGG